MDIWGLYLWNSDGETYLDLGWFSSVDKAQNYVYSWAEYVGADKNGIVWNTQTGHNVNIKPRYSFCLTDGREFAICHDRLDHALEDVYGVDVSLFPPALRNK